MLSLPFASPLAPLVLYPVTAFLALRACHRTVTPIGRRTAAVLLLLPLCLTGRALLTGDAYGPIESAYKAPPFDAVASELGVGEGPRPILHDIYTMILPGQQAVRHAWSHGEWPLRNPFILCGHLLAGSGQPAPFYPPNLLSMLLAPALAPGFLATLHFFFAALGGFLLARDFGCRPWTALFAAAGWMAVSCNVFWVGWPLGAAMIWLPLMWLGVRRVVHRPGIRSALLLAVVFSLEILAGHPETAAHFLWIGGIAGLWELAVLPRQPGLARAVTRRLGWVAAAGAITAGLTAIFVLPLVDGLSQSFEWAMRGAAGSVPPTSWAEAARRLLAHTVPLVQDFPPRLLDAAEKVYSSMFAPYAGSVLLAPAVFGLLYWRRRERWQLVVLAVLGLLAGIRMPVFHPLLDRLPLLDRSINDRLIAVTGLALVLLAALGLEAWCERRRRLRPGWIAAALLPPMALACLLLWRPLLDYGERIGGQQIDAASLTRNAALWLIPVALSVPLLLSRRGGRWALAALFVLLLGQRTAEVGGYYPTAPPAHFYPAVAPIDVPFPADEVFRIAAVGGTLLPAQSVYYGLEDIRGYDAVNHLRYRRLTRLWTDEPPGWFNRLADLDNPVLSLLNVRWVLIPRGLVPPDGWRLTRRGPNTHLWRNPDVLDRAFVPDRVRFVDQPRQILPQMRRQRDFSNLAWIEPPGPPPPPHDRVNGPGTVEIERDGLGYRLRADMEAPGWVVITDVAWRGWRARSAGRGVSSRELPLGTADYAFLALELPAGRHEVELFFRPRSFEAGLAITAATVGGLLLAAAIGGWRRRRHSPDRPVPA